MAQVFPTRPLAALAPNEILAPCAPLLHLALLFVPIFFIKGSFL